MKAISAIAMIRGDDDILPLYLDWHLANGLNLLVVLHMPEKIAKFQLAAAIKDHSNVIVFESNIPRYNQADVLTLLAEVAANAGADWIVPLDADEFLTREAIELLQSANDADHLINFSWQNAWLKSSLSPGQQVGASSLIRGNTAFTSPFGKVAFPAQLVSRNLYVNQGGHSVRHSGLALPTLEGPSLLHLPIRSVSQLHRKLDLGSKAYLAGGPRRDTRHGQHWFTLQNHSEEMVATDIPRFALRYGEGVVQDSAPSDDFGSIIEWLTGISCRRESSP